MFYDAAFLPHAFQRIIYDAALLPDELSRIFYTIASFPDVFQLIIYGTAPIPDGFSQRMYDAAPFPHTIKHQNEPSRVGSGLRISGRTGCDFYPGIKIFVLIYNEFYFYDDITPCNAWLLLSKLYNYVITGITLRNLFSDPKITTTRFADFTDDFISNLTANNGDGRYTNLIEELTPPRDAVRAGAWRCGIFAGCAEG